LNNDDNKTNQDQSVDDAIEEKQDILMDQPQNVVRNDYDLDSNHFEMDAVTEDGLNQITKSINRNSRRASLIPSKQQFSRKSHSGSLDVIAIPIHEEEELGTIPVNSTDSNAVLNHFPQELKKVLSSVSELHSSTSSVSTQQLQFEAALSRTSSQVSLSRKPSNTPLFRKKPIEPRAVVPLQFAELLDQNPRIIVPRTSRTTHWKPSDLDIVII
jgi:hypothetical protein